MLEEIFLYLLVASLCGMLTLQFLMWKGLRLLQTPQNNVPRQFSVIVAARNEESGIAECLQSLVHQDYPKELYEILVVNDRSTDATPEIIARFCSNYSNVRTINITELRPGYFPKKNALTSAIEIAKFEIVAFTDADCVVPKNWLATLSTYYTEDVGVVAGRCKNSTAQIHNIFGKIFYRYEELKGSINSAAGIGMKTAYVCKGGNFSYRKKVYEQVGGFAKINHSASGDDDLFLQLIQRETTWKICYMRDEEAEISTTPPLTFSDFLRQRKRHISASKYYAFNIKLLYGVSHTFTLVSLLALCIIPLYALIAILVRMNIDAIIMLRNTSFYSTEPTWTEIFIGELLLILFTVCIGPLGYTKSISWKESSLPV